MTTRFLLTLFFVVAASAQTPEWIWFGEASQTNATTVYFRKTFRTPPLIWNSRLTVSADDQAEVFLNGISVAKCIDWQRPSRSEVTVRLNQGENVIAIKAQVKEGARGLLVHFNLAGEINLVSDSTWLATDQLEEGWSTLGFNAAHWKNARSFGPHGIPPWGEVLFRAAATAPEMIKVPEGFRVELLRSAEPAEGSWICMTFDDKGRIIVSPQGENRRLLRMTMHDGKIENVETIPAPISYAMGLLQAFDSLYVNGIGPSGSGLYRLIDADKNDQYETNELRLLKRFEGGSEHGYHALALGPDKKIYVLNGNGTKLPDGLSPNSPYRNYAEDALTGARGEELEGTRAPNCHVLRTDADGKEWELFAGGMRNAYDFDFNDDGELFTFDSDNEWDFGVPWYRPTRVIHLVSGAEAGWRDGTRMWTEHRVGDDVRSPSPRESGVGDDVRSPLRYPDALPTTAYVGIGSPTGVKFARGKNFPPKYRRALFIQDWSYGRTMAVHLTENGATYTGTVEPFLEGAPLNVTGLNFGPDGAMYFITGGRGTQSGLYRVSYTANTSNDSPIATSPEAQRARETRRNLEALHREAKASDLDLIWNHLASPDAAIRLAARIALEAVPVANWKDRALTETDTERAFTALLALARVGSKDDQPALVRRLERFPLGEMQYEHRQLAKLRIIEILIARHDTAALKSSSRLMRELRDEFPTSGLERNGSVPPMRALMNHELARILLQVDPAGNVSKAVHLMGKSISREEELFYVEQLRNVKEGWSLSDRQKFFSWFLPANPRKPAGQNVTKFFADVKRSYVDGASYDRYLRDFRRESMATLTPEERQHLEPLLAKPITQARLVPGNAREFVRDWKMEDLIDDLAKPRQSDFSKGRQAFVDAQCLSCHRFGNDGGTAGPDLTAAASKYTDRDLLESIIEPSKIINEQYQDHTAILEDGEAYTGRLVSHSDKEVIIETDRLSGAKEKIDRTKIKQLRPAATSPMPSGLVNVLTKDEILDLLAYLRTTTEPRPTQ
jgi:putative heme-binding domain-containing protein